MKVVGVLGGGQLGQMLADAAQHLDLEVRLYDPSSDACGQLSAPLTVGRFEQIDQVLHFAEQTDVITYEFENIPVATIEAIEAAGIPVHPGSAALRIAQDRLLEKQAFAQIGLHVPRYAPVSTLDELSSAVEQVGLPAVLKARREGYDGKGQCVLRVGADPLAAWDRIGRVPCILEAFVPFARELSVILARGRDGMTKAFSTTLNEHRGGILHLSSVPAERADRAQVWAARLAESVGYTGVLALELFETVDGELLGNEWAPRVHNSGHWTMDAGNVSQFEQHLRAVVGLPLVDPVLNGGATMVNLVGQLPPPEALSLSGMRVHLYGKQPRVGRKLGHINWVDADPQRAVASARQWAERWLTASADASIRPV